MAEGGRGGLTDTRRRRAAWALAGCAAAAATLLAVPAVTATTAAGAAATAAGAQAAAGEQLLAWGSNRQGDLGDGTTVNRLVPVQVDLPAGTAIAGVAAGTDHSLARTAAGRVLAWGANADGELGIGTTASSRSPVAVRLPAGTRVTSVKAGCYDSLALTSAGRVLAWGKNEFGELGDGTRRSSPVPVRVALPSGTRVSAISAGCFFNLALTTTGRVLAWGRNYNGSLGDGNLNTSSRVPVRVRLPRGIRVTAVSAGGYFGLALTASGRLFAWGYNGSGELGDGGTANEAAPVAVRLPTGGVATGLGGGPESVHSFAVARGGA